jgi:hypothetical protein
MVIFDRELKRGPALLGGIMLFKSAPIQFALGQWRNMTDMVERSAADNIWFEQRVSDERQRCFEEVADGCDGPVSLRKALVDHWNEFIRVDDGIPHTFLPSLIPASFGPLDMRQRIVRIESLIRPLEAYGLSRGHEQDFSRLRQAFERNETELIDGFVTVWNESSQRDWRPAFATFKDEVLEDLKCPEWPSLLRDRLGLAHYDCAGGPIPIALMEYSVGDVVDAAMRAKTSISITVPTVLDSVPWPYFFPSPVDLSCGRAMTLYEVDDDRDLLAEILHFRIAYRREHLVRLDEIRDPPRRCELKVLRNHHLLALRLASGDRSYGEEMPG